MNTLTELINKLPKKCFGGIYEYVDRSTGKTAYIGHSTLVTSDSLALDKIDSNHRIGQKYIEDYSFTHFRMVLRRPTGDRLFIREVVPPKKLEYGELLCVETLAIEQKIKTGECDLNYHSNPLSAHFDIIKKSANINENKKDKLNKSINGLRKDYEKRKKIMDIKNNYLS